MVAPAFLLLFFLTVDVSLCDKDLFCFQGSSPDKANNPLDSASVSKMTQEDNKGPYVLKEMPEDYDCSDIHTPLREKECCLVIAKGGGKYPTNIASVNLVTGCSKVFFFRYCNSCPGVLTLHK